MERIRKQKNGKFGIWETITDSWRENDFMTVHEAWKALYEPQIAEYERQLKKFLKLRELLLTGEYEIDKYGYLNFKNQSS